MTILFLGSGPFGLPVLDYLHETQPGLHVATVPDAPKGRKGAPAPTPIKARALEHGVPCHEVATLKKPTGLELLERAGAQLVITADIRLFLTSSFLAAPTLGCFNLHGSLLPGYRGAAPVARGVLAGDLDFGVSLYRMVKEMDAGPIVGKAHWNPGYKVDTPTAESHLSKLAPELLAEWLPRLLDGTPPLEEQDHSQATLAPKIEKSEGLVPWEHSADQLENHVLALKPWPRSYCHWYKPGARHPVLLFLDDVLPRAPRSEGHPPGTVVGVGPDGIDVACGPAGREVLQLLCLQRAGKRSLPVAEFLRGAPIAVGDRLGPPDPEPA